MNNNDNEKSHCPISEFSLRLLLDIYKRIFAPYGFLFNILLAKNVFIATRNRCVQDVNLKSCNLLSKEAFVNVFRKVTVNANNKRS